MKKYITLLGLLFSLPIWAWTITNINTAVTTNYSLLASNINNNNNNYVGWLNQTETNIAAIETNLNNYISTNNFSGTRFDTVTASNGIATYGTNSTVVSTSSTISNNQTVQMTVWLTAATGLSLTNAYGTNVFRGQTITVLTPITLQPRGQLVGTAITCVGTNAF